MLYKRDRHLSEILKYSTYMVIHCACSGSTHMEKKKWTTRGEVEWTGNAGREPRCYYIIGGEVLKNSFSITHSSIYWGLGVGSVLYMVFCRVALE